MKLTILETSDTHGFLLPTDYQEKDQNPQDFSLSRVKNYFNTVKNSVGSDHVLTIDNGDFLQGSALASYVNQHRQPADYQVLADAYNQLDYDFGVLGNHDFNYGADVLNQNFKLMERKFLTANVIDVESGEPFSGQGFTIIEKSGLKIGIIGVTTEYVPHWENPKNIAEIQFVPVLETLAKLVPKLRQQVDLLVVSYHGGFERDLKTNVPTEKFTGENVGSEIVARFPEIDILLTGHQHRQIATTINGVAVVQPGYQAELVGRVDVQYQQVDGQIKVTGITPSIVKMKDFAPDQEFENSLGKFNEKVESWLDQPLGTLKKDYSFANASKARIMGTPSLNLIHQIQLANSGADISAASIVKENVHGFHKLVTTRDLMLNYPYTSEIVTVEVTGAELREILEFTAGFLTKNETTGEIEFIQKYLQPKYQLYHFDLFYPIDYQFDLAKKIGHRLVKLQLKGQDIKDTDKFELVVNKFRVQGGGRYPIYDQLEVKQEFNQELVEMVIDYLKAHPNLIVDETKNYLFK